MTTSALRRRIPSWAVPTLRRARDGALAVLWRIRKVRNRFFKPTVGLVGFFGWGNYGDELFLDVWKQELSGHFKLKVLPDLQSEPYFSRGLKRALRGVDVVLIGGGDLVIPWRISPVYWRKQYLTKPVFVAGVGVPTWGQPKPEVISWFREYFNHPNMRYVHARDPESVAWIEQNLQPAAGVIEAPDLVCALDLPHADRLQPPLFGYVTRYRPPTATRPAPGEEEDIEYDHLRRATELMQSKGYKIRRIILGTGKVGDADYKDAQRMQIPGEEVVYSQDCADLSKAIGECSVFASMKFHGTVVATMYGVPSVVMMPTAKSRNFMRRIGREDLLSHYDKDALLDNLARDPEPISAESVAMLRERAREQILRLRTAMKHAATH